MVTITHAGTDDGTVNTMLNSLVFNNTTNNDPSTTARTVTLTSVTDSGSGLTADGTVATVNVAKADDAIDITVTGNTVLFTEDAGATTSLFSSTIDTIETTDTITEVVLTLANVESGDTLSFGATNVDLNTNGATVAGGFTYTVSSAGATPVVTITHAGTDDATVNTMLNSLVFNNTTNNDPSTTARTVTLTSVTDSGSGTTADGTVATVNVTAVNDVPTAANNTVTTNEDTTYTFKAADFNYSDPESDTMASVKITTLETVGSLQLSGIDVTINQVITKADIDANNLKFVPLANGNGTSYDSFGFSVNDGTADSASTYIMTVDVTAVNDAPDFDTAGFTANTVSTGASGAASVTTADMDGDGDMDVLSASFIDNKIAWYENDGSETFTVHTISTAANSAMSVTTADVDGDGDLDVLSASTVDHKIA
ncbi:MAG: hypothetical protein GY732_23030, partial [Gammaproteobacteria bacterium]|nr:hypothetical protein [Gammaproteobacteria bacterium]